jgi:thioredoxin reductase (NADPH)
VLVAGDGATYAGKLKLIATGFAEAAMALKSALEFIRPDESVKVSFSSVRGLPAVKV